MGADRTGAALRKGLSGLGKPFTALLIVDSMKYLETSIAVLNEETRFGASGIYVTLNRPYVSLINVLKKNKCRTDGVVFIDCITKTAGQNEKTKDVVYVRSPQALTALSIAVSRAAKELNRSNDAPDKFLILDALTTLAVYNPQNTVSRFLHSLINMTRILKLNCVLLSTETMDSGLSDHLEQLVDQTIDLNGKSRGGRRRKQ